MTEVPFQASVVKDTVPGTVITGHPSGKLGPYLILYRGIKQKPREYVQERPLETHTRVKCMEKNISGTPWCSVAQTPLFQSRVQVHPQSGSLRFLTSNPKYKTEAVL